MTEMFKLQEFIVPQADVCVEEELYFRTLSDLEVKYNLKEGYYSFYRNDVLEGNTYFNSMEVDEIHTNSTVYC